MAEIGNDVSKRIYEAKVAEIIAKRATPDCSKEQRENWIKAKYVTRAFINTEALKVMISAGNQVLYFTFLCFLFFRWKALTNGLCGDCGVENELLV